MITSNVSNTKNRLSELLQKVRQGETVTIVDRNRPVARIVPILPNEEGSPIARLVAEGVVQTPLNPDASLAELVEDEGGPSLLNALLMMREEERG